MTDRHKTRTRIRTGIIILVLVVVCGYTGYEIHNIVFGPRITILSPQDGSIVTKSSLEILGIAKNIQSISLDDRAISVDEQGNFDQTLLLLPGYNNITIRASDKFGRTIEKVIEVVYQ